MTELSIFERRLKLSGERAKKEKEFMIPYDREVYNPAMDSLRDECALIGHEPSKGAKCSNGMFICSNCGASYYRNLND